MGGAIWVGLAVLKIHKRTPGKRRKRSVRRADMPRPGGATWAATGFLAAVKINEKTPGKEPKRSARLAFA